jgi:flagellar FliJ protein
MSTFRLAGLLRLRRLEEERAAAALAHANAEREAARRRREEHGERLTSTSLDEQDFTVAVAGRAALFGLYAESTAYLALASARADEAGTEWSGARTAVRMIDKLAERHAAGEETEALRAEQLLLDETAIRQALTTEGDR